MLDSQIYLGDKTDLTHMQASWGNVNTRSELYINVNISFS
jgi:hypothetical protein